MPCLVISQEQAFTWSFMKPGVWPSWSCAVTTFKTWILISACPCRHSQIIMCHDSFKQLLCILAGRQRHDSILSKQRFQKAETGGLTDPKHLLHEANIPTRRKARQPDTVEPKLHKTWTSATRPLASCPRRQDERESVSHRLSIRQDDLVLLRI